MMNKSVFTTEVTEVHRGRYQWGNGRYCRYGDGCWRQTGLCGEK